MCVFVCLDGEKNGKNVEVVILAHELEDGNVKSISKRFVGCESEF